MKTTAILFFMVLISLPCSAQGSKNDTLFVASWNLENLFDTVNDPFKEDEEFLPESIKSWTSQRLDKKLNNLARVIHSMNYGHGPDILGVVETEHQWLLDRMDEKFLADINYQTAYLESPDSRGIDNGLIYKRDMFHILSVTADTINLADGYPTRLVLNVNLLTLNGDTIHVFENHWPSRSGGESESEINRIAAAEVLKKNTDEILAHNPDAFILIMGDFNDEPTNISILNTLKAQPVRCDTISGKLKENKTKELYNLAYDEYSNGLGTYKYKNDWNMLDQIIVSHELLTGERIHYICGSFRVYKPDFLVTHSGTYEGTPFPTYGGNKYLGGYSDHFPVTSEFLIISKAGE